MQVKVSSKITALVHNNTLISLAGNGLSAVLGVALLGTLARWLQADLLGMWILYQMSYTLFDFIRMGSLLNPFIQRIAAIQSVDETRKLVGSAWQLGVLFTIIVAICLVVSVVFIPSAQKWVGGFDTIICFILRSFAAFTSLVATWWLHSKSS